MLSKNKIKFINSLKKKKFRTSEKLFIAEGEKIVNELLNSSYQIHSIFSTEQFLKKYNLKENDYIFKINHSDLRKISTLQTPNQVLALIKTPEAKFKINDIKDDLTLALSDINDPGNLGTIIRIADWFGITKIICSEDTVDAYNPKVIQSSMGSISRVSIYYKNLKEFIKKVKEETELNIYGTTLSGENIYSTTLKSNSIVVLGSESHGISEELIPLLTKQIRIPKFSKDAAIDSLNVSIATGIICAEIRKG